FFDVCFLLSTFYKHHDAPIKKIKRISNMQTISITLTYHLQCINSPKQYLMKTHQQHLSRPYFYIIATLWAFLIGGMLSQPVNAQANCWLETQGTQIINANTGQPVILRAVGLGNWLLQEGYMLNPQGCTDCPGTQWEMKKQYYNEGQS